MDKPNNKLAITSKIYDLIYELNQINSDLLVSVLPQLENKLLSTDDAERLSKCGYLYENILFFVPLFSV